MKQLVLANPVNGPGLDFLATDEEIIPIRNQALAENLTLADVMGYPHGTSIRLWHDHPGFQCTIPPFEPDGLLTRIKIGLLRWWYR